MKTYGNLNTQELVSVVTDEDGNPRLDTLAPHPKPDDWMPPTLIPLVKLPKPDDTDTQVYEPTLVWFDDRVERDWIVRNLTAQEIAAQQLSPAEQLTMARAEMSGIIATLPVASRAKFSDARAGIEKLLDIGDLEAALYRLDQIEADTEEEGAVKAILVAALSQFVTL
jgi:hypothetical protein